MTAEVGRELAGAAAGSYLLAVALVFAAWLLTGQILERHAFQHAPYRWLARTAAPTSPAATPSWTESTG